MTIFGFTPECERQFHNHIFLEYWNEEGLPWELGYLARQPGEFNASYVLGDMEYEWKDYLKNPNVFFSETFFPGLPDFVVGVE